MRDPEVYAEGVGELPEDYRIVFEGMSNRNGYSARQVAGRFPLGPGVGHKLEQNPLTRRQFVNYTKEETYVEYVMDRLEERLRSVKQTASRPPWIEQPAPEFTRPIDVWNDTPVAIAAVGPAGGFVTLFEFTIPDFHLCRLDGFGQWIETAELASSISWAIAINGQSIPDGGFGVVQAGNTVPDGKLYDNFNQIIGTIAEPGGIFVTAQGNDVVSVLVENELANDAVDVKARLKGWMFRQAFDTDASCKWSTPQ